MVRRIELKPKLFRGLPLLINLNLNGRPLEWLRRLLFVTRFNTGLYFRIIPALKRKVACITTPLTGLRFNSHIVFETPRARLAREKAFVNLGGYGPYANRYKIPRNNKLSFSFWSSYGYA